MTSSPTPPAVAWMPWGPDAFARASAERRPILLSISASWCHGCAVMDTASYADRRVAALVAERLIPVRVDADRRPDVNDRYNLDGWPTTVLLTPSGEMLTGTTYLPADGLLAMLEEVTTAYASGRDDLERRAQAVADSRRTQRRSIALASEPDLSAPDWLAELVVRETDAEYGGFGASGKFLHIAALTAALACYARYPETALGHAIGKTLDALASGGARDQVSGGFFRYTSSREWMRPHTEKMIEDQAGILRLFLEAARVFDRQDYLEVARETIGFVESTLASRADGRFYASQAADDSYYQLGTADLRRAFPAPQVDTTLITDWTAQATAAWIAAGDALGDPGLAEFGGRALDAAIVRSYRPGDGVAHYVDADQHAGVRGLLTDQVHAARALLDLHDATANPTYSMIAEELMRTALRTLWDPVGLGFYDRPPDGPDALGLLASPLKPLAANSVAAVVLARLSRLTGDTDLQQRALQTLASQTPAYRGQGLYGAPYALAVLEIFE
jgi:uncharacterized protein YyaL (SSP411 family)